MRKLHMFSDFRGGLNTDAAPDRLSENELLVADNVEISERGEIIKRRGFETINEEPFLGNATQVFEWPRDNGEIVTLAVIDKTLYVFEQNDSNELKKIDTLGLDKITHYTVNDKLYYLTGTHLKEFDGEIARTSRAVLEEKLGDIGAFLCDVSKNGEYLVIAAKERPYIRFFEWDVYIGQYREMLTPDGINDREPSAISITADGELVFVTYYERTGFSEEEQEAYAFFALENGNYVRNEEMQLDYVPEAGFRSLSQISKNGHYLACEPPVSDTDDILIYWKENSTFEKLNTNHIPPAERGDVEHYALSSETNCLAIATQNSDTGRMIVQVYEVSESGVFSDSLNLVPPGTDNTRIQVALSGDALGLTLAYRKNPAQMSKNFFRIRYYSRKKVGDNWTGEIYYQNQMTLDSDFNLFITEKSPYTVFCLSSGSWAKTFPNSIPNNSVNFSVHGFVPERPIIPPLSYGGRSGALPPLPKSFAPIGSDFCYAETVKRFIIVDGNVTVSKIVSNHVPSFLEPAKIEELLEPSSSVLRTTIPRCKFAIRHTKSQRYFYAGNPDEQSALYYSEPGDPGHIKDTSKMFPTTGDGPITGLAIFVDAVLVFFKNSIWAWRGIDPEVDAVWHKLPTGEGTIAPHTICTVGTGLMYLGARGIINLSPSIIGMNVEMETRGQTVHNVTENKIEKIITSISNPEETSAAYDPRTGDYLMTYRSGEERNVLVLNEHFAAVRWIDTETNDVYCGSSGKVLFAGRDFLGKLSTTSEGFDFPVKIQTPFFALDSFVMRKLITKLHLLAQGSLSHEETTKVDLGIMVDNKTVLEATVELEGEEEPAIRRKRFRALGSRASIKVEVETKNSFKLYGAGLEAKTVNSYGEKV